MLKDLSGEFGQTDLIVQQRQEQFDEAESDMERKIKRTTFLVIVIMLIIAAVGIVVLNNTDRIAVRLAPKKQAATSRSEVAKKADELFWQTFHHGEYENIQRALDVLTAAYLG